MSKSNRNHDCYEEIDGCINLMMIFMFLYDCMEMLRLFWSGVLIQSKINTKRFSMIVFKSQYHHQTFAEVGS